MNLIMLYFSSIYLKNKTYQSFEDLFQDVSPERVVLVYDTNIVIYHRDFYLNPKCFVDNPLNKNSINAIRYLNENVNRYNLEVLASFGVDESSRQKSDFSLNIDKWNQTHNALMSLLHLNYHDFDKFIQNQRPIEAVIDRGVYPNSMLLFLEQNSSYQQLLIVMYIFCLKVILLYYRFESKEITGKEAVNELNRYMRNDINCVSATMSLLSLHLFGGSNEFMNIFFPKNNLPINEKLHKIFNGSIDLIIPTIINKEVEKFYKKQMPNLIPVIVSSDKKISNLLSLMRLISKYQSKESNNYFPELLQVDFLNSLKWNNEEMNQLFKFSNSDFDRFISFDGIPRSTTHLLKYVKPLEDELVIYWNKKTNSKV